MDKRHAKTYEDDGGGGGEDALVIELQLYNGVQTFKWNCYLLCLLF